MKFCVWVLLSGIIDRKLTTNDNTRNKTTTVVQAVVTTSTAINQYTKREWDKGGSCAGVVCM